MSVGLPPTIQELMKRCFVNKPVVDICQVVKDDWQDSLIGKSNRHSSPTSPFVTPSMFEK
jgi:hypothetical protein